jgi:hypothetical protein
MDPMRYGGLIAKRWPVVGGVLLLAALGWTSSEVHGLTDYSTI